MLIACIVSACSGELSINQVYSFDLLTMPVPKKIVEGETVEIRLKIVREGDYAIRSFTFSISKRTAKKNSKKFFLKISK
jgi:hypothetical protein